MSYEIRETYRVEWEELTPMHATVTAWSREEAEKLAKRGDFDYESVEADPGMRTTPYRIVD